MLYIPRLYGWAVAHPEVAFALAAALVALMRSIYAVISRIVKPYPRLRAAVEAVASLAPDVARFGLQAARAVTGRAIPSIVLDSRDAEIDRQRQVIADQAVRIRQLAEAGAVIVPSRTAAEGIERALESTAASARSGQNGSAPVAALAVVSALGAALAFGLMLSGCPVVREGVMQVTPGVPDRSDCAEGAYRCNANVPEACSATHRWWPTIPRDPSGAQRVCPAGCAVAASGVAYCAASIDGGAL